MKAYFFIVFESLLHFL